MENLSVDDTHIWCPIGIGNSEISQAPIGRTYQESLSLKRPITQADKLKIEIGMFNEYQLIRGCQFFNSSFFIQTLLQGSLIYQV